MDNVEHDYSGTPGYTVREIDLGRGRWRMECATLPELVVEASSRLAVFEDAHRALEQIVTRRMKARLQIPAFDPHVDSGPGTNVIYVTLGLTDVIKVQLYEAMRRRSMSPADLMRILRWHRTQIDRLLQIGHPSRLDQIEDAANALKLRLSARLLEAVKGVSVQVTEDGDGWRVRLALKDPEIVGEMLTEEALSKEESLRIASAVKRALDLVVEETRIIEVRPRPDPEGLPGGRRPVNDRSLS